MPASGAASAWSGATEQPTGEFHVVFGTGPVGLAVMDELVSKSKRVRIVNRSGRASVPHGVEVIGGDATDEVFTREASDGASVVYFALNPPYNKWPTDPVNPAATNVGAQLTAVPKGTVISEHQ